MWLHTHYQFSYPLRPCWVLQCVCVCVCVCVWAMGCTCMLKFSRHPSLSVCARIVLHVSTYTCIMTQKCATKRTNNYCLLAFAGSCYRARVSMCVCETQLSRSVCWAQPLEKVQLSWEAVSLAWVSSLACIHVLWILLRPSSAASFTCCCVLKKSRQICTRVDRW